MRLAYFFSIPCLSGGPALADPGHLAAAAGHSHWVAGAAIAIGIGLSLWGALSGGRKETDAEEEAAEGSEGQEA